MGESVFTGFLLEPQFDGFVEAGSGQQVIMSQVRPPDPPNGVFVSRSNSRFGLIEPGEEFVLFVVDVPNVNRPVDGAHGQFGPGHVVLRVQLVIPTIWDLIFVFIFKIGFIFLVFYI